jgi:hypothetical protein
MKTIATLFALTGILCAGLTLAADDPKILAGPRGGRLLENTDPVAEFHREKDHTVTIAFYDQVLNPSPPAEQSVTVIATVADGKKTIEFEKIGDVLASKGKLPDGDGYLVVVQFRQKADATPQNFRFKLQTHICDGCKREEYACTCDE